MIAVLMGGYSAEREISLLSGEAVYQALCESRIDCFSFDLNDQNLQELWKIDFNKAFIFFMDVVVRMALYNLS